MQHRTITYEHAADEFINLNHTQYNRIEDIVSGIEWLICKNPTTAGVKISHSNKDYYLISSSNLKLPNLVVLIFLFEILEDGNINVLTINFKS